MSIFDGQDGWGYCRPCNRLVETDPEYKRFINHRHALNGALCPGSRCKPSKLPKNPDRTMHLYSMPVDLRKEGHD